MYNIYKRFVIGIAVLALIFSTMGTVFAQELAPQVKEMVGSAKAAVKKVSADELKAAIDAKEDAIILDIRDGEEYAAGHLPGAMNISRGTLEFKVFGAIPDLNAKIYVYCKTSGRATLATKTLNDLGYKNAILADLNYADWVKAGYPVER
jgi:rhodanese-related sulfurtransferase